MVDRSRFGEALLFDEFRLADDRPTARMLEVYQYRRLGSILP